MEVENVIYPVRFFYFNTPCLIISVSLMSVGSREMVTL